MGIIRVSDLQWDALSKAEQDEMIEGLRDCGAIGEDDEIIGDPGEPEATEEEDEAALSPSDACKEACEFGARKGKEWCNKNTKGVKRWACNKIVKKAKKVCLKKCETLDAKGQ